MKKAVILARVSTPNQAAEGLSLEKIQLPQLRQYATDNGFEVVQEFVFQETADAKIRKKFIEMVDFVKADKSVEAIITFRVDRITRNFRDAVEMDLLRTEYKKELHFVSDRLVIGEKSFGRDIQDWDMKVFLAKQQINRMKEDSHNTIMSKLRTNEIFNKAPYGYVNYEPERNLKSVKVNEFEAGIVRLIFDLYTTGIYSYLQIRNKLNDEYNVGFATSKVEKIIKCLFYIGYREYEGQIYPHKYERIIPEDVWEMAKDIREGRNKNTIKSKLKGKVGLYRGLIKCKTCGCSMTPEFHKKKQKNGNVHEYVYYRCTGSKGKHSSVCVNEKQITEKVSEVFRKMVVPKDELEKITQTLKEAHEGKIRFDSAVLKECQTQIKLYERRKQESYTDKLDGRITQEEYDNYYSKCKEEQKKYQDRLAFLTKSDDDYYITADLLLQLASRSYEIFLGSEPEEKREILKLVFSNLLLDEGSLEYMMEKPFDSIFKKANRLAWGG